MPNRSLNQPTRRETAEFIIKFRAEHGVSPSVREIATGIDRTISTTHTHIQRLLDEGLLRMPKIPGMKPDVSRCLLPTEALMKALEDHA